MSERLKEFCLIYNTLNSEKKEGDDAQLSGFKEIAIVSITDEVDIYVGGEDCKLQVKFHRVILASLADMIRFIINYINSEPAQIDVEFIQFLYQCKSKAEDLKLDFKSNQMYIDIRCFRYEWHFTENNTIINIETTMAHPTIVIRISALCREYNKNREMSKESPPQQTITTEKTRGDRVDDAIEKAIYDMLKEKPVNVDVIVKLRSLLN